MGKNMGKIHLTNKLMGKYIFIWVIKRVNFILCGLDTALHQTFFIVA